MSGHEDQKIEPADVNRAVAALRSLEVWLFAGLMVASVVAVLWLKPLLATDRHALGPHAVSLFVPFAAGLACLGYLVFVGRPVSRLPLVPILVCLLLSVLFADVLFQPLEHYRGDDPWRYSTYAHNMLESGTLWGSDGLYHGMESRYFVDQPGYRYYLAGMIWLAGGENRLMQLLNLLVLLSVLVFTVQALARQASGPGRLAAVVSILAAPYAAKNAVQGLSEWLAVSLVMLYVAALLNRRHRTGVICLGLTAFVRQNLIPFAVVMAAVHAVSTRRAGLLMLFVAIVLLPVYHNLYYAGEIRLLVENKGALFDLSAPLATIILGAAEAVIGKLPGYVGIPPEGMDLHTTAAALLFAPAALAAIVYSIASQPPKRAAALILMAGVVAGPSLVFGHAYFPRFVYTNYLVTLLSIVAIDRFWRVDVETAPGTAPRDRSRGR